MLSFFVFIVGTRARFRILKDLWVFELVIVYCIILSVKILIRWIKFTIFQAPQIHDTIFVSLC